MHDYYHCCIDDNNTRVLYERVLSSMPVDTTQEIWSRFTEFESAVGDLSSLIKVEKRRGTALREVTKNTGNFILLCVIVCVCRS